MNVVQWIVFFLVAAFFVYAVVSLVRVLIRRAKNKKHTPDGEKGEQTEL